ncbi:MAG: hypothetical protein U0003_03255 [Vampirovibrionales bacterium]
MHTSLTTPLFGWFQAAHQAIRQGGANTVAHPGLRHYLNQQAISIGLHDDAQDQFKPGPSHYVNLEDAENRANNPYTNPQTHLPSLASGIHVDSATTPWPAVAQQFSLNNRLKLLTAWHQQPLAETDLPQGTTVFDSIVWHTNALTQAFIAAQLAQQPFEKTQAHQAIQRHAGALAHYAGDLTMPLHTTHTYNWSLAPNYANRHPDLRQGIHAFIEGDLLSADDYARLQQHTVVPVALTRDTLKPFLLQTLQNSHLRVFDVFQAHQRVVEANPYQCVANPEGFKTQLKQALQPLIITQLLTAQQVYASLLDWAYQSAQQFEHDRQAATPLSEPSNSFSTVSTPSNPFDSSIIASQ